MRRHLPWLLLPGLLGACSFNSAGLAVGDRASPPADRGRDRGSAIETGPELRAADRGARDQPRPDSTVVITPIDATALGQAFGNALVPCVDMEGRSNGTTIPIADDANVRFLPGSTTLANASAALKAWAGNRPAATVAWNPNACVDEWPLAESTSWTEAGLLIRGASLDGPGRLVLEPGLSINDLDVLDIFNDGGFEQEVFAPDDSGLASHPPLVGPVTRAKQLILKHGYR